MENCLLPIVNNAVNSAVNEMVKSNENPNSGNNSESSTSRCGCTRNQPLVQNSNPQTISDNHDSLNLKEKLPEPLNIFLGIQHCLIIVIPLMISAFALKSKLCILSIDPAFIHISCSILMVSGIATLLQSYVGIRLAVVQGPNLLIIAFIMLSIESDCPSDGELFAMGHDKRTELWQGHMMLLQGSIIAASAAEIIASISGLTNFVAYYFSPVSASATLVSVCVTIITKYFINQINYSALILFIISFCVFLILKNLPVFHVPFPVFLIEKGIHFQRIPVFHLFPVLILTGLMWAIWYFGNFSKLAVSTLDPSLLPLSSTQWLVFPYPFQWGVPEIKWTASFVVFIGMFVGFFQSLASFHVASNLSEAESNENLHLNHGILIESLSGFLSGIWGAGIIPNSCVGNLGMISISQVTYLKPIKLTAYLLLLLSMCGKITIYIFAYVPHDILMATFFSLISLTGVQAVHMLKISVREITIFIISLCIGLVCQLYFTFKVSTVELDPLLILVMKYPFPIITLTSMLLDNIIFPTNGNYKINLVLRNVFCNKCK